MPEKITKYLSSFTKQEVDHAFKTITSRIKINGLTILKAPQARIKGRILIIIPKKAGKANLRNQIRRRLKSIFYEEKLYEQPYDWIVLVNKEACGNSFSELKKIMEVASQNHEI